MNTILIYEQPLTAPTKFLCLDGDYSHLNGVIINDTEDEALTDELSNLIYRSEDSSKYAERKDFLENFPVHKVAHDTKVIVCGFAP